MVGCGQRPAVNDALFRRVLLLLDTPDGVKKALVTGE